MAKDLDLTETALREWVRRADIDAGKGPAGALTQAEREELARLRKENRRLLMERDILKKAAAFFAKEQPVKFAFIEAHEGALALSDLVPGARRLPQRLLRLADSRAVAASNAEDEQLAVEIVAVHERSRKTYGSPRVHAELRARGMPTGRKRVARLMRSRGPRGALKTALPPDDRLEPLPAHRAERGGDGTSRRSRRTRSG